MLGVLVVYVYIFPGTRDHSISLLDSHFAYTSVS